MDCYKVISIAQDAAEEKVSKLSNEIESKIISLATAITKIGDIIKTLALSHEQKILDLSNKISKLSERISKLESLSLANDELPISDEKFSECMSNGKVKYLEIINRLSHMGPDVMENITSHLSDIVRYDCAASNYNASQCIAKLENHGLLINNKKIHRNMIDAITAVVSRDTHPLLYRLLDTLKEDGTM